MVEADRIAGITGAATLDVVVDLAGAATVDAAVEVAGAATFDVAVAFEVAVDLPRHVALPNFLAVTRELWEDMFEPKASWSFDPRDS